MPPPHPLAFAITLAVVVIASAAASTSADTPSPRPNILWLIAEDFGPHLGCYGTPEARTPNLDALAAAGVRYTRAFTVTAVCSTSRSSFMTGMYCFSIGAHNHRSHRGDNFTLPDGVRVLTDWFRPAGYFTANISRFAKPGDDAGFFQGTGKTDWNFKYASDHKGPFDSGKWDDLKQHQPFFAQINFSETHRGGAWNEAHKHVDQPADPAKVAIPPYYPDHPIVREDWAQYLNAAMALDRKVGYVLARLEADGLADNTIVVFFGDHGAAMMRAKQWPYESGLSVPLIVRWPKAIPAPPQIAPGKVDDRLVMSIDWSAMALWAAGVERPAKMQGRSFLGPDAADREYVFGGRDRGDETVDRIRTVRDKRFRYIRNFYPDRPFLQLNRYKETTYPTIPLMRILHDRGELNAMQEFLMNPTRPTEELYDLDADPHEIRNLADDPAHRDTIERLRSVLDKWLVDIDDQGRFPEPPEVIEANDRSMNKAYEQKMKAARERVLQRLAELEQEGK